MVIFFIPSLNGQVLKISKFYKKIIVIAIVYIYMKEWQSYYNNHIWLFHLLPQYLGWFSNKVPSN